MAAFSPSAATTFAAVSSPGVRDSHGRTLAWIALAAFTWGYGHEDIWILTALAGIVLGVLWATLIYRIIQARYGHFYRLTTRRLFVSTGLFNRRKGWELLQDEIVRSDRYQRNLCVITLDIDNFKTINDTQGHLAGDLVLKTVAKVAGETVRSIDHLFRWGGEEFLVVLPDTELEAALHVAERLREAIARTAIQISNMELNVTGSLGVTRKDENTPDLETLLARADQAMYVAKHLGRNRVASSK